MTSPASPYIAPEGSDKKWWDPFGLFASKPAPSNPPSDFTPSASPSTTAGRRRKHTLKKAGRRHRSRKGGMETKTPMQKIKYGPKEYRFLTDGYRWDFPPTQSRRTKEKGTKIESPPAQAPKPTGKGRRTRRVKKHSRK